MRSTHRRAGCAVADEGGIAEANTRSSAIRQAVLRAVGPATTPIGSLVGVYTDRPHAVLTFDDGPQAGATDAVLAALAERSATATFFVLVERVEREPRLLAEIVAAGHEVGMHGIDHRRLSALPAGEVRSALAEGKARLQDQLGLPVRWFRPPHGAQTPRVWRAIRAQGLEPVLWSACAWDWLPRPVESLATQALLGLDRGAVLLAHDGLAWDESGTGQRTAPEIDRGELVRRVLDGMAERGLAARSLGEALRYGRPRKVPWFRR
ncbi:MAG: polysaccharide deacetylase family protein [Sciscionella sp.]